MAVKSGITQKGQKAPKSKDGKKKGNGLGKASPAKSAKKDLKSPSNSPKGSAGSANTKSAKKDPDPTVGAPACQWTICRLAQEEYDVVVWTEGCMWR